MLHGDLYLTDIMPAVSMRVFPVSILKSRMMVSNFWPDAIDV